MTEEKKREGSSEFPFDIVGVTGATGTVAAEFIPLLLRRVPTLERIVASCRRPESEKGRRIGGLEKVTLLEGSILDLPVMQRITEESGIVYHLAAWLANTTMPDTYEEIFAVNALATAVAVRLCDKAGKRIIFTSSHSVYFAGEYRGIIAEDSYEFRVDFLRWIEKITPDYYDLADRIISGRARMDDCCDEIARLHRGSPPPMDPLIYDKDEYHLYCLTKLLAESFVLDHGGCVLRLSNVYGLGDDSTQAVGEACRRLLDAAPGERIAVRQPFKKLVPVCIGDINEALFRGAAKVFPEDFRPVFTMASQKSYLREDELLKTVAEGLKRVRGGGTWDIETLPPEEDPQAFRYDLSKLYDHLLPGYRPTAFVDGLEAQLRWLIEKDEKRKKGE